jgi:hypothetical protein
VEISDAKAFTEKEVEKLADTGFFSREKIVQRPLTSPPFLERLLPKDPLEAKEKRSAAPHLESPPRTRFSETSPSSPGQI